MTVPPDEPTRPPGPAAPVPYPPGYLPPQPFVASSGAAAPPSATAGAGQRFAGWVLNAVLFVLTLGIGWLIWDVIAWSAGRNPAWQILGLRAVHAETGAAVTWGHMFVRNFLCYGLMGIVPFWQLVGACFVFGSGQQALWDRMAKTYVISER